MLKVDWKLVEEKAEALYPRYAQGMTYSELEAELAQEGFDQNHINQIAEALDKKHRNERTKGINIPLLIISIALSVIFVVGVTLVFETGYIAIAAGVGVLVFVVARMIIRTKSKRAAPRERWREDK